MTTEELRAAAERVIGPPPLCRCDKPGCRLHAAVAVARALLARLPPADDGEAVSGPRYIAWVGARQFYLCGTLAEALDWRAATGAMVYEPLGMTAAERAALGAGEGA